ncbi:MAG: ABC transporter six-transmembrane domain-containing protein [Pseudomonadota bacterium]
MLKDEPLTIATLLRKFAASVSLTWFLTFCETALVALVPLFIGFAIDGLLVDDVTSLLHLAAILASVTIVGVLRRLYDTRAYGRMRVELGKELVGRGADAPLSQITARLDMSRELVDFLEQEVPALMSAVVQLAIAIVILFSFHAVLSTAAVGAAVLMVGFYAVFHRRFFRLNAEHNHQMEQQVHILEKRSGSGLHNHLNLLRRIEIRLSDTEAWVYGAIFLVLLAFILFNLWFASIHIETSVGTIFSIISYSWEFVDAALVLPVTLQGWSRLSEIMRRINDGG